MVLTFQPYGRRANSYTLQAIIHIILIRHIMDHIIVKPVLSTGLDGKLVLLTGR